MGQLQQQTLRAGATRQLECFFCEQKETMKAVDSTGCAHTHHTHLELLLKCHDQLHNVQAVKTQVFLKVGAGNHLVVTAGRQTMREHSSSSSSSEQQVTAWCKPDSSSTQDVNPC